MEIAFHLLLFILGACFGSFLCCQARRLRYNSTHKTKLRATRSICLHCKKNLKWYDNLPLISWLILKGKCRYCHHKIGIAEFLAELATAFTFLLLSFAISPSSTDPLAWTTFIVSLLLVLVFIFLAIYDGLYGELPSILLTISIICAIILLSLKTWAYLLVNPFNPILITDPLLSATILGGLYFILYLVSKGRWVGDGDPYLALAIALALGHPFLSLLALFLANFSACLISLPLVKGNRKAKIHFGPFLVLAFVITYGFSHFFISLML